MKTDLENQLLICVDPLYNSLEVNATVGRKRTSNKKDMTIYVDKDLIKRLKELELNASAIFTEAALKKLEEYDGDGNKLEEKGE